MIFSIEFDKKCDKSFLRFLKTKLKFIIGSNIKIDYMKKYNKELSEMFEEEIDCIKLIKLCANRLKFIKDSNIIFIILPKTIKYTGTTISAEKLLKIIEFGTLELKPYPIISKSIHELKKNIDIYYNRYKILGW